MMDLLTGMVVMSIVVAMVFFLVTSVHGQAFTYQDVRVRLNDYRLLKADLDRRIEAANQIGEIPGGFSLTSDEEQVSYILSAAHLLRRCDLVQDTLYSGIDRLELTHLEPGDPASLVTGIAVELQFGGQLLSCFFYKDYGISQPINNLLYREL